MRKTIILAICLVFFTGFSIQAEKLGTLEGMYMPLMLEIAHDQVYCLQETTVHAYRLKDLKPVAQFGKKGEGPGELMINPGVSNYIIPLGNSIMVVGINKAVIFSLTGERMREFRLPGFGFGYIYPLGEDTYLVSRFDPSGDPQNPQIVVGVTDEKMEWRKQLYRQDFTGGQNQINLTADGVNLEVAGDRIFIEQSARGFMLSIYDFQGELIRTLTEELAPVKFTSQHEEAALDLLKQNPAVKSIGWENFKSAVTITHDEHLPLIRDMVVDGDRIYLMSTRFTEDEQEFVVMDLEGGILQKVMLPQPLPMDFISVIFGRPNRNYQFYRGRYYYLKENLDEETWELHAETL